MWVTLPMYMAVGMPPSRFTIACSSALLQGRHVESSPRQQTCDGGLHPFGRNLHIPIVQLPPPALPHLHNRRRRVASCSSSERDSLSPFLPSTKLSLVALEVGNVDVAALQSLTLCLHLHEPMQ